MPIGYRLRNPGFCRSALSVMPGMKASIAGTTSRRRRELQQRSASHPVNKSSCSSKIRAGFVPDSDAMHEGACVGGRTSTTHRPRV